MGFMTTLGRLFRGEPVFEVPQSTDSASQNGQHVNPDTRMQPATAPSPEDTPKVAPLVYVERLDGSSNPANPEMDCELHIRNHSSVPIRLERLDLLGRNFLLNKTYLQPGQEWEYKVPVGNRPTTNNYREAKLYYETEDGDDFCSVHTVEYQQLADRTYNIVRLHFMPPVRNV